jgi:hypothetical protein
MDKKAIKAEVEKFLKNQESKKIRNSLKIKQGITD